MLSACLDSNVFISGIVFKGKPYQCIEKALFREYQLILSSFIIEEVQRNLILKFDLSPSFIEPLFDELYQIATIVEPKSILKIIKGKDTDNRILEAAVVVEADYLVSGDKQHILPLKSFGKTKIVTPEQFLKVLA